MDLSKIKKTVISTNYALLAALIYVGFTIQRGATYQDAVIIGILSTLAGTSRYLSDFFRLREKVITENDFRAQVNADIAEIKSKVSIMGVQAQGVFNKPRR